MRFTSQEEISVCLQSDVDKVIQVHWNTTVCTGNRVAVDSTVFIKCVLNPDAVAKGLFLQFSPQLCDPNLLTDLL